MIIVWIEKVRKVTASGSRCKEVTCEGCGTPFTYDLHREATAEDDSLFSWTEEDAYRKAEANARKKLDLLLDEEDVVLCPECGWVQERMVEAVRKRSYPGLKSCARLGLLVAIAAVLIPLGIFGGSFFLAPGAQAQFQNGFFSLAVVGALISSVSAMGSFYLWFLRRILNTKYNPNKTPPRRLAP